MKTLDHLESFFQQHSNVLDWGAAVISALNPPQRLKEWVEGGFHGSLRYMSDMLEMRMNPALVEPWAKSLVLFLMPYPQGLQNSPYVASYALGKDYHILAREIGLDLQNNLKEQGFAGQIRVFADSAPVAERDFAVQMGLGWLGKNSLLIHRRWGSAFLIGGVFLEETITRKGSGCPGGKTGVSFCGDCTLCMDACPSQAIVQAGCVEAEACVSCRTIEDRSFDKDCLIQEVAGYLFGCDICQQVCPWNKKASAMSGQDRPTKLDLSLEAWCDYLVPGGGSKALIKGSALMRAGRKGLMRNLIRILKQNPGKPAEKLLERIKQKETDPQLRSLL